MFNLKKLLEIDEISEKSLKLMKAKLRRILWYSKTIKLEEDGKPDPYLNNNICSLNLLIFTDCRPKPLNRHNLIDWFMDSNNII